MDEYGRGALANLSSLLRDESKPPLERVRSFLEAVFQQFEHQGCRQGCLLGNLGQELADAHARIRRAIEGHLKRWADAIKVCLDEAAAGGDSPGTSFATKRSPG